jgi:hypothetical protein
MILQCMQEDVFISTGLSLKVLSHNVRNTIGRMHAWSFLYESICTGRMLKTSSCWPYLSICKSEQYLASRKSILGADGMNEIIEICECVID